MYEFMYVCVLCVYYQYLLFSSSSSLLFLSQISFSLGFSFSATANFGEPSFPIRLPPYSDG